METPMSRLNLSSIIAACIVAGGLITAARIVAQRPVVGSSAGSVVAVTSGRPLTAPPLSQETIARQVREQALAAPELQMYSCNSMTYTLKAATASQVSYNAKDDDFMVIMDLTWEPAMHREGPQHAYVSLNNNGYNEYIGSLGFGDGSATQNTNVRVK